ncbi:Polypeptide N-acetylgalactosaminyltransferase 13 [Actinoplanes friuliensis DSM 7358]|uniref:Polypeptide N-acetylgalactosaminyltransferase 13 n=2 Tax=Actinoplanes friuliensis TaxID=196914 RepID=U5W5S0_9ACTN|nr:Polypeptide N-acetylgalactosaminyltransferase 13 [Actinoplanes friuliensis DSM 7358]
MGTAILGLLLVLGLPAPARAAESNGGVRIMPLGASITDGFNVPGGYRIKLWELLTGAGHKIDFVGSAANGPASLGDHDHEGHSGWRIDQIDANVAGWLRAYAPRTILVHLGTNDVNQNYDLPNAPARLGALIDKIRANAPTVELFISTLAPETDPVLESRIQDFNAAIPGIVAQKGPLTHLVDIHAVLTTADIADGTHPTAAGYDKMGARWFSALQATPSALNAQVVPPVGVTVAVASPLSGRCLDVPGTSTTNGTQLHIYDCLGSTIQRWTRSAAGELRVYGDRCLDINGNGTADGTKAQIWTCNGTTAQRFTFQPDGTIVGAGSGKCLDVTASGTTDGTLVQLYTCNGTAAQRWSVR